MVGYDRTNVVMYIILFLMVALVLRIETRDWACSNAYQMNEYCDGKGAMPYRGSKPEEGDSVSTLLYKIDVAAGAEQKSIKWRRALTLSFFIALISYGLVITPGKLPKWTDMYLVILIGTSILYFSFNYYSYHAFKNAEENIKQSTDMLRERVNKS